MNHFASLLSFDLLIRKQSHTTAAYGRGITYGRNIACYFFHSFNFFSFIDSAAIRTNENRGKNPQKNYNFSLYSRPNFHKLAHTDSMVSTTKSGNIFCNNSICWGFRLRVPCYVARRRIDAL